MDSHDSAKESISSNDFRDMMMKLRNETNPQARALKTQLLSEALLRPHGFEAYYEYVASFSDDTVELINLFCKIVLSRPSKFDNDLEYLNASALNFAWIIIKFSKDVDQQIFFTFLTKLFYFMRRSHIETHFGFFLEPILSVADESDVSIFEKLCSCNFYIDELYEFYSTYLKHYIMVYLTNAHSSSELIKCIKSGFNTVNFNANLKIFTDFNESDLEKILNIWCSEGNIPPQHVVESALIVSFPSTSLLDIVDKNALQFNFNSEFRDILKEKTADNIDFNRDRWSRIANWLGSASEPSDDVIKLESKDFITNLSSDAPTDIAFGLFEIRKQVQSDPKYVLSDKVLHLLFDCLFHEDSYVYANAIKTCVIVGKVSAVSILEPLLTRAVSNLNFKNAEVVPRFIEIFDELLVQLKNSSDLSSHTSKFCLFCSKYILNSPFEVKISIFNYYIDVLAYDSNSFISNQQYILNTSTLSAQSEILDSDVGAEVFFKMIDSFLTFAKDEGRHMFNDSVLADLNHFLKNATNSSLSHVSAMAYYNLILLERIKK